MSLEEERKTTKGLLLLLLLLFFSLRLRDLWPVQISKTRRSFVQLGVETSKRDQNEPTTGLDRRRRGWRWRGKVEEASDEKGEKWLNRQGRGDSLPSKRRRERERERDGENSSGGKKMAGVWNTTHEAHNRFSSISVQVYSIFFQQKISFPIDWLVLLVESNDKVSSFCWTTLRIFHLFI